MSMPYKESGRVLQNSRDNLTHTADELRDMIHRDVIRLAEIETQIASLDRLLAPKPPGNGYAERDLRSFLDAHRDMGDDEVIGDPLTIGGSITLGSLRALVKP